MASRTDSQPPFFILMVYPGGHRAREVVAEPGEGPPAILKRQRQRYDERRGVPTLAVHCYRKRR